MPIHTQTAVEKRSGSSVDRPANRTAGSIKGWAFNWRLLIVTGLVAAAIVPLVHFWHAFQVDRNASSLLVLADTSEARDDWLQGAESLHRYLQLRPDDVAAIIRMAEDFYKGAKSPQQRARAVQLYARAIALAPDRDDLQRRQMGLRLETGDHRAALAQAQKLLAKTSDDAEALRVQALALHRQKRLRHSVTDQELLNAYQAAIDKNPSDAELASGLAIFYRSEMTPSKQHVRPQLEKLADDVMNRLVDASGRRPQAYVARYLYRREFNLPDADSDLDEAIAADKSKEAFEVWWLAGMRAIAAGNHDAAVEDFKEAIKIDPTERRGHLGLGNAYRGQGNDALAIQAWQAGLDKASPGDVEFELLIAGAEVRQEHWERAEAHLKALEVKLAPMTGMLQQADWLASVFVLRGEVAIGQKDFGAALAPLKQAAALRQAGAESLTRTAAIGQVQTHLGQCYSALGQWDQAALAYQRAAEMMPNLPGLRAAAGACWESAGRYDEASRQYDEALLLKGVEPNVWVAAANAEYLRQHSSPKAQQDWQSVGNLIAKAKQSLTAADDPEPLLLAVVESEYDAQRGLVDQAVSRFRNEADLELKLSGDLLRRLVLDYERWGRSDEADRMVERLCPVQEEKTNCALLAAELKFRRNQREEAFRLLTAALSRADKLAQHAISDRLAIMYLADGKPELAKPLLRSRATADKNDVAALQLLAELALRATDLDEADVYTRELESREGSDGTNWRYYRALRLLQQASNQKDRAQAARMHKQAGELQEQIQAIRPSWAPGFLLKARLAETTPLRTDAKAAAAERLSDDVVAIQAYVQAIRLGARSVPIYEALIFLLFRQNRFSEAELYLSHLSEFGPLPENMTAVAMAIDVDQGNIARAIDLAREQTAAEPSDAMRHLRLGMLLAREAAKDEPINEQKLVEAESELRRSQELSLSDPRAWAALLSFYRGSKQDEKARNLLAEIIKSKPLGEAETAFFLAQGYASLGDEEKATTYYVQAAQMSPDRLAVQFQSGMFFIKRDARLAEECLRRTLTIDPSHRPAAELLAVLLASSGGSEQEVDRLLSEGSIEPDDRRLHAMLMLRRGDAEHRRRAQEILEALAGNSQIAASLDRLLLARLYETEARLATTRGDAKTAEASMAAALDQLKTLVNVAQPEPEHLAAYIDNLLRSGRAADATGRLEELAAREPEAKSVRTLSLRLRWLKEQKRASEIQPLIDFYVKTQQQSVQDPRSEARVLQGAAELYSTYNLLEKAEQALHRAAELDSSAIVALVDWLNKHQRTSDAIQFCLELADKDRSALPALMLANVLALSKPTAEESQAAQAVIDRALQEHADNSGLLFAMSTKCLMDGKNEESIRLLRKVLKLQPRNIAAMNNLAFLLSTRPDTRGEAEQWMAKAIGLAGGNPELIDSKGWILLQQQKFPEAIQAFEEALAGAPGHSRFQFHLALAYQMQGKLQEARDVLAVSLRGGLDSEAMAPDERSALSRLKSWLQ